VTGVVYDYTRQTQQAITLVIDPLRVGTDIAHDRSTHDIRIGNIWVQELQEQGFASNRQQFGNPDKKLTLVVDDDADDNKLIQKNLPILVDAFVIQRRDLVKRLANPVPISN
jgi:ribulose 1,5-bisphosphate synthetase/thiazole synthase